LVVVAQLARDWFERHLISGRTRHRGELQIEASGAAGTGTPAERLSGWIIQLPKPRPTTFYREPAHEIQSGL
jgi:hypothetical protein